jgi:hypothetical protein
VNQPRNLNVRNDFAMSPVREEQFPQRPSLTAFEPAKLFVGIENTLEVDHLVPLRSLMAVK